MKVNLERGGIIWQMRQHIATTPGAIPLDKDAGEFDAFAADMIHARREKGTMTPDELADFRNNLLEESKFNPIGRVVRVERDLPNHKRRLFINLALLNESVGIMPPYRYGGPDIRRIGRVAFLTHSADMHSHSMLSRPRYQSRLYGGFDVLTDGEVNMTSLTLEECIDCSVTTPYEDDEIVDRLSLGALYADKPVPALAKFSPDDPYTDRRMFNQKFTDEQVSALLRFLREKLKPEQD